MPDIYLIYEAIRTAGNYALSYCYGVPDTCAAPADWDYQEFDVSDRKKNIFHYVEFVSNLYCWQRVNGDAWAFVTPIEHFPRFVDQLQLYAAIKRKVSMHHEN